MSTSESEFVRRFREPIKRTVLEEHQRCPRHRWNLRATMIEVRNSKQHCFQCQFEDEIITLEG